MPYVSFMKYEDVNVPCQYFSQHCYGARRYELAQPTTGACMISDIK